MVYPVSSGACALILLSLSYRYNSVLLTSQFSSIFSESKQRRSWKQRYPLAKQDQVMTGGNIVFSEASSPCRSMVIPTPQGTQPSPNECSNATFAAKPEQCIGMTYVGAGRSCSDRNLIVGSMRSAKSDPPR